MSFDNMLRTLNQFNLKNKRILLRVAYDITLVEERNEWVVPDDQRIKATLPTINYLLEQGCSLVLMSWLGRPEEGKASEQYSLRPVSKKLQELLGREVRQLNQTIGPEVDNVLRQMQPGDIVMLENTRFNVGESEADPELAKKFAAAGEFVVFDAFAQAHRVHASTTGILENHPNTCAAGLLMQKEITVLNQILQAAMPPFVVVLGGAKISDKITMLRNVLNKAAMILVGGALANPFLKALGYQIGSSLVEGTFVDVAKGAKSDPVAVARELIENTKGQSALYELIPTTWPNNGRVAPQKLQLPLDVLIAKKNSDADYDDELLTVKKINSNLMLCGEEEAILDIGPHTIYLYTEIVKRARTIFWNGPMGFFEDFNFSNGTKELAEAVADSNGFSIIGGGDTEAVVTRFNLEGRFGHVSTGGGASLAVLAGEELPVMRYLKE